MGAQTAAALGNIVVVEVQHGVEDMAGALCDGAQDKSASGLTFRAGYVYDAVEPGSGIYQIKHDTSSPLIFKSRLGREVYQLMR